LVATDSAVVDMLRAGIENDVRPLRNPGFQVSKTGKSRGHTPKDGRKIVTSVEIPFVQLRNLGTVYASNHPRGETPTGKIFKKLSIVGQNLL